MLFAVITLLPPTIGMMNLSRGTIANTPNSMQRIASSIMGNCIVKSTSRTRSIPAGSRPRKSECRTFMKEASVSALPNMATTRNIM